ncbi:MAG: hypothetical protein ACREUF_13035 [Solimonas sp.]
MWCRESGSRPGSSRRTGEPSMAKSQPKIALSESRDIPFNKLVLSQSNVRRVKAGIAIEELAQDIARRTLLQSLTGAMRERLSAYGLFHEIIAWKLRMFVPTDAAGVEVLAKLMGRYQLQRVADREVA